MYIVCNSVPMLCSCVYVHVFQLCTFSSPVSCVYSLVLSEPSQRMVVMCYVRLSLSISQLTQLTLTLIILISSVLSVLLSRKLDQNHSWTESIHFNSLFSYILLFYFCSSYPIYTTLLTLSLIYTHHCIINITTLYACNNIFFKVFPSIVCVYPA